MQLFFVSLVRLKKGSYMYIDLFLLNQSVFSIRDGKLFYPKGYSRNKKYGRAHLFYNDAYNNS